MKTSRRSPPSALPASTRLADVLFTPVQQRVLGLLFGQPKRRFQSAEVIRLAGSGTGAAHRLLTRLAATGLVTTERVGNQKHYQANARSPVFAELSGLIRKTARLASQPPTRKGRTASERAGGKTRVGIYSDARVREFDESESELKKLPGRS